MDAQPLQERTGLRFRREREGIMHARKHDTHVAMLASAARLLGDTRRVVCSLTYADDEAAIDRLADAIEPFAANPPSPDCPRPTIPALDELQPGPGHAAAGCIFRSDRTGAAAGRPDRRGNDQPLPARGTGNSSGRAIQQGPGRLPSSRKGRRNEGSGCVRPQPWKHFGSCGFQAFGDRKSSRFRAPRRWFPRLATAPSSENPRSFLSLDPTIDLGVVMA